nr:hypothetical protein Iba_chr15eCG4300 [Ipomoea batatas]
MIRIACHLLIIAIDRYRDGVCHGEWAGVPALEELRACEGPRWVCQWVMELEVCFWKNLSMRSEQKRVQQSMVLNFYGGENLTSEGLPFAMNNDF